jgi:hypothetical protein
LLAAAARAADSLGALGQLLGAHRLFVDFAHRSTPFASVVPNRHNLSGRFSSWEHASLAGKDFWNFLRALPYDRGKLGAARRLGEETWHAK